MSYLYATKLWSRRDHVWIHREVKVRGCDDCGDLRGPWYGFPVDLNICRPCAIRRGLLATLNNGEIENG